MTKATAASQADIEDLYRRHAGELRGYLFRRAGEPGVDLLGEVFVIALRRRADLPEPGLRRAWLFGTARRLLLATYRTSAQRQHAETEHVRRLDAVVDVPATRPGERSTAVRDALGSLKEKDRELIRLTEWEGLTITEAATVLGVRPGTARVRLHRARKAIAAHPSLQHLLA